MKSKLTSISGIGIAFGVMYGHLYKDALNELKRVLKLYETDRETLKELLRNAKNENQISKDVHQSMILKPLERTYAQDDPELIQIIQDKYLIPPPMSGDYNIKAKKETSMGQAQVIRQILDNKVSFDL